MNTPISTHSSFAFIELQQAIFYCLRHYDYVVDRVAIQHILQQSLAPLFQQEQIQTTQIQSKIVQCLTSLNIQQVHVLPQIEAVRLPLIAHVSHLGWGVITQSITEQQYQFQQSQNTYQLDCSNFDVLISIKANDTTATVSQHSSFSRFIRQQLSSYRGVMGEAIIATFVINAFALAISLFSMQVYDRVIPTRNENTLIILASGVALVILLELVLKVARSKLMDKVMIGLDVKLSEHIYQRLLGIRLDLLPTSVGSMAAQLRGYEQIRSFYTSSTLFNLVDLPMGILFIVLIAVIGSVWVALVPLIAGIIAVILGLSFRHFMDKVAKQGATYSYLKTGLLVETVEGMETIKSGFGQYKFLTKWTDIIQKNLKQDIEMKHLNDYLNYIVQTLQQLSYIGIVIVGSYVVMDGKMTMGAMIACSILGGRVLNPIMQIPNLLVQSSHAKVAKQNLDQLFQLKQDNDSQLKPLMPSQLLGNYQLKQVKYLYQQQQHPVLDIEQLDIKAGERIAILGAIGSGKSTLLKLLSGLYIAQQGQTLLDGLDIQQIHSRLLQQKIGYLQQDHRLFQGTLRDNLLIGLAQPSDDELNHVLTRTGLMDFIQHHPKGLDLEIYEGGKGLSGGQKQLLAFSRLILTRPQILLLDEPTSSMDNRQEQRCIQLLNDELKRNQTVIISTHKMSILPLVERIIVMERGKIIMDGSKQAVLDYFQGKRS